MTHHLTTGTLAKSFQVAPRTVTRWCDTGMLRHHLVPGSKDRRITVEAAIDFALQHGLPLEGLSFYQPGVLVLTPDELLFSRLRQLLPGDWQVSCSARLVGAGVLLARRRWSAVVVDGDLGAGLHEVLAHLPATQPDVACGVLASEDGSTALSHAETERVAWTLQRPADAAELAKTLAAAVRRLLKGSGVNGRKK